MRLTICKLVDRVNTLMYKLKPDIQKVTHITFTGSTEAVAITEYTLEKIAFNLKRDPIEVRLLNMVKENNPIPEMINKLKQDANFERREKRIKEFNHQSMEETSYETYTFNIFYSLW